MIKGMFESGGLPVLERVVQFTEARHRLLTHNIANLSTPNFQPVDLDPKAFQQELVRALDERRTSPRPFNGPLPVHDTVQVQFKPGRIATQPSQLGENVLFHDRNDRDLERLMQKLAENTLAHNAAVEMMRNQLNLLNTAIRERV